MMAQPNYPGPAPGTQPRKGLSTVAIVLIVVGTFVFVLIAIVGVLGAMAVYGTRKYVQNAKAAEGRNALGVMARGMTVCMSRESAPQDGLLPVPASPKPAPSASASASAKPAVAAPARSAPAALPPTTTPVPASLAEVSGIKYQSAPAEWEEPAWKCMGFAMRDPQYFQYQWERTSDTTGVAHARADLDGDGRAELDYELHLTCTRKGDGLSCTVAPNIIEK